MRIADFSTSVGRLQLAVESLDTAWSECKKYWHDRTSRKFEEDYLAPLAPKVRMTVGAINRLSTILQEAQRDLADEDRGET